MKSPLGLFLVIAGIAVGVVFAALTAITLAAALLNGSLVIWIVIYGGFSAAGWIAFSYGRRMTRGLPAPRP